MTMPTPVNDAIAYGSPREVQLTRDDNVRALLKIKKGNLLAPLLLVITAVLLFVIHGLDPGLKQLADNIGLKDFDAKTWNLETLLLALEKPENLPALEAALKTVGPNAETFSKFVLPGFKAFVDQLAADFRSIAWSSAVNVTQLGLFALIGGIGGLIYRRAFWIWFAGTFAALALINTSGVFGSLTTAKAIPFSGDVLLFIVSQAALVLLAYRLRRQARSLLPLSTALHNWLLFALLTAAALAIIAGYVPNAVWSFASSRLGVWEWLLQLEVLLIVLPLLYTLLRKTELWQAKAPKTIVVLLDGTSNTPDQQEMGFLAQTNVFKLFSMLKADKPGAFAPTDKFDATLCKTYGNKQIGFYYTGIGNKYDNDPLLGTIDQATGLGASGIIERAYQDIVRVYRPGDRVVICGFSRGAASARILARTLDQRGAPRSIWTLRLFGRHWTVWSSKRKYPVTIDVLGCWDTVGSFGVAKTIAGINFQQLNLLHDMSVPDNVRQAYHMVALDEERKEFEPTLMEPDPIRPERIVEVWFSGSHASVGGGWATDRLSDVPLAFLLERISSGYCKDGTTEPGDETWGVHLAAVNGENPAAAAKASKGIMVIHPDPLGQLRTWISKVYNYRPRELPLHAVISEAVFERMMKSAPVYAPQALFDLNDALDKKRDMITEKVHRLEKTKSLDEDERVKVLEFADKLRLTRWPKYWDQILETRSPQGLSVVLSNAGRG